MKRLLTLLLSLSLTSTVLADIKIPKELQGKTINVVVPYSAGGNTDVWARINAAKIKDLTGLDVVVLNKAGADGLMGAHDVANAKPDGTTLLATDNGPLVLSPLFKDPNAVSRNKFVTVTCGYRNYSAFYVRADSKYLTLKDLLDDVSSNPGKVNIGAGYPLAKIIIERTLSDINGKVQIVKYKGAPQATNDLLGGHLDVIVNPPITLPQVRAGKLRVLAFSSPARLTEFPGVPVINEFVPGATFENFSGVYAPVGTPNHIVDFYNKVYREAAKDSVAQEFLKVSAANLFDGSPADAEKFVQAAEHFWKPIVNKYYKPNE